MDLTDQQLALEAGKEMRASNGISLTLQLDLEHACQLLSMLQLALRHPLATGRTAKQMRVLAKTIEARLGQLGPATAELFERGWKPDHDLDPEEP